MKKAPTLAVASFYIRVNPRKSVARVLVSSAARPAASAVAVASPATATPTTTAASTIPSAAARTSTAPATISAMRTIALRPVAARHMRRAITIEVRLAFRFIREIAAAFNHHRARRNRRRNILALCAAFRRSCTLRRSAAHFPPLLVQNRFARKPDAVAFHRQHLHQHLIAFLQLVADVANAMLRHFADVQQPIGPGDDLDKRA